MKTRALKCVHTQTHKKKNSQFNQGELSRSIKKVGQAKNLHFFIYKYDEFNFYGNISLMVLFK